ncbi:hypothetical protein TNCV_1449071 [Trichonephila clavipes]|nr:hypothetical protein TNCV_1449071 [Trichonephila clavipes]
MDCGCVMTIPYLQVLRDILFQQDNARPHVAYHVLTDHDIEEGLTAAECFQSFSTFPNISPSCDKVFNWFNEFKHGRRSLEDNPRSGRSSTSTTEGEVWSLVREDPRITHQDIAGILKISSKSVNTILHDYLLL